MGVKHPVNRERETTQSPFEKEFEREILLSERLRLTAILVLASVILSAFLIWRVFFNSLYHQVFGSRLPIPGIIVFFCGAIASALVIRKRIDRSLHTNKNPPKLVRYVIVFAEARVANPSGACKG